MLVPGLTINAGRVLVTVGAAVTPNFFNQGVGFLANGRLPIDSDAPVGTSYRAGIRRNPAGAFYGTTSASASDVYLGGVRISAAGQIVYADAVSTGYINGTPVTATGALAGDTA
jgi:hypothetical protein